MVTEGHAPSRARAQALIRNGTVAVAGKTVTRPSATAPGAITLTGAPFPYVARSAAKLLHALDHFGLTPHGAALDLGASTGGFTQVLLERGAAHVHAVDVGRAQLHPDIARDPRVTSLEGVNAKDLPAIPAPDWITADLSFIALTKALAPALTLARPGATLVALIKPQFELEPAHIGKNGRVKAEASMRLACERVTAFLSDQGWTALGLTDSPILGGDGAREFLTAARK